jgi:starch synthase
VLRVLHVASEVAPYAQTGGLGDVVAGLPAAQVAAGIAPAVLAPLYRSARARLAAAGGATEVRPLAVRVGPHALTGALHVIRGRVPIGLLDLPALYDRAGGLYGPGGTADYGDNHLRFGALGAAAADAAAVLLGGLDVVHAHDWQGSPAAIYAHLARAAAPAGSPFAALSIITTIHNLAFRGIFPKRAMDDLGLPWSLFTLRGLELYDQLCLLKGGLAVADAATTVSPTYAQEILQPARGEGLHDFLRWDVRRLAGIVNGIDVAAWDPAVDPALPAPFSRDALDGRRVCRAALIAESGLAPLRADPAEAAALAERTPIIGVVSRLGDQKGTDLIAEVAPALGALGARVVVLGDGDPVLEARLRVLAAAYPDRVAVRIGFEPSYARRLYAGCDLFAMPSRFEPCGLGQLYAMRYGAVPIVHAVGGLRDTVIDPGPARGADPRHAQTPSPGPTVPAQLPPTGLRFDAPTAAALHRAIARAVALFHDPVTFQSLQRGAMARDSSWTGPAHEYAQLYRSVRA